jgi:hypothetical protein
MAENCLQMPVSHPWNNDEIAIGLRFEDRYVYIDHLPIDNIFDKDYTPEVEEVRRNHNILLIYY